MRILDFLMYDGAILKNVDFGYILGAFERYTGAHFDLKWFY